MIFALARVKSEQLNEDLREIHIDAEDTHLCEHLEDVILAPLVACIV